MLAQIDHLFFHVSIMLFPILFYHLFLNKKKYYHTKVDLQFVTIVIIMLLLTMSFPVEYEDGMRYDFKIIPIAIAFLYAGPIPGLVTLIIMLFYSLIGDSSSFLTTFVHFTITSLVLYLFPKKFKDSIINREFLLVNILLFVITLLKAFTLIIKNDFQQLHFQLLFSLLTWVTLLTIMFIIENLKQQIALQTELQRAEKLKVISQLAASVAHEVRNPITSINGFLQLMKYDSNITSSQRKYIEISLSELNRAQSIINDYLSLAKPNNKVINIINLSVEINKIIDLMTSFTNIQNIIIESSIEESLYIKASRDEIRQVLINLIKNGIEAIDTNGMLHVRAYSKNRFVYIEVIDNGVGMNKKQLSNLGTPFYSTKDKGTGIGLTITYQLIELMKGKILVDSSLGIGTTFTILLPKVEQLED